MSLIKPTRVQRYIYPSLAPRKPKESSDPDAMSQAAQLHAAAVVALILVLWMLEGRP